jgi:dTDP-4-amino-4,6-dideoxygalactose transaminase
MYDIGLGKVIHFGMYQLRLAVRSADGRISRSERLPHWQASLIRERLAQLDETNEHRRGIMAVYQRYFGDSLISKNGTIRAAVAVDNRADALKELRTAGYGLYDTWYDTPVGPEQKYRLLEYPEADCPNAVELARHIINLPTHEFIHSNDAETIAEIVRKYA